jgi:NAD(P)-dependent dehydrogenase (short-subunit alcohol dehydrogenase family)
VAATGRRAEVRRLDLTDLPAAAVVQLASPEASYTRGASFVVDGGLLLMAAQANR